MQKYFEVKLYSQNGEFKKQINPKNITSDIEYTELLDGGQGNLNLSIVGNANDFLCSDIIEIRESQRGGVVIPTYTGVIERIRVQEFKNNNVITLELLGIFTLLNDIIYKSGSNRVFTKTDTAGNIIKDIIDYFNSQYGVLNGDTQNLGTDLFFDDGIDDTGTTISIEFSNTNCLEAIKKVLPGFQFYIGPTGGVAFKQRNNFNLKYLTFDREIVNLDKIIKKDDMINSYYLERTGGVVKNYQNAGSIATFNLKELFESKTELQNKTTQDIEGNNKVDELGYEINEISITIKSQNNDFLTPGYLITTQNTNTPIIEQQITKIDKKLDFWTLYIGDYTSFGKTILNSNK